MVVIIPIVHFIALPCVSARGPCDNSVAWSLQAIPTCKACAGSVGVVHASGSQKTTGSAGRSSGRSSAAIPGSCKAALVWPGNPSGSPGSVCSENMAPASLAGCLRLASSTSEASCKAPPPCCLRLLVRFLRCLESLSSAAVLFPPAQTALMTLYSQIGHLCPVRHN